MNKTRLRRKQTPTEQKQRLRIEQTINKAFNKFIGYYKNYERN